MLSLKFHNLLLGLMHPITPFAETIYLWHRLLIIWLIPIWFIVIILLIWGITQFNNNLVLISNLSITHHSKLELFWTLLPFLIVIIICFPSIILLYNHETQHDPAINVKILGKQWFWKYEIHTNYIKKFYFEDMVLNSKFHEILHEKWKELNFHYDLNLKLIHPSKFLKLGNFNNISFCWALTSENSNSNFHLWSLIKLSKFNTYEQYYDSYFEKVNAQLIFLRTQGVDNILILPTQCFIRFLITGYKVIHSFYVPALGFKADGVPGRISQLFCWIENEGIYLGGCYELCGAYHHQMPIILKAIKIF
jgi:heme/copper-type cytochrome/quinol oxidase subunit 2